MTEELAALRPHPLRKRARKTYIALTKVSIPKGESINADVDPDEVIEKIGLAMASMPWEARVATGLIVRSFNWLALLRFGRPFTALDEGRQAHWMKIWVDSPFVLARLAVRALLTLIKPVHLASRKVQAQLAFASADRQIEPPESVVELPADRVVTAIDGEQTIRVQAVVVGSGAGGAVVAAELAERGVEVAIVETGRFFSANEMGRDSLKMLREAYRDGGATIALGRPGIPIPIGNTVGGTTTINSGTCFRTPDQVFDKWQAIGLPVDRAGLDAAFARVEKRINVRPVPPELLGGSSHVIAKGCDVLGLKHGPLKRNIGSCRMSAMCAFGCPRDAKQSMNVTYVPDALANGATLYSGFRAEKIIREGGRAKGIIARPVGGGPKLTIHADVVVSACGTVGGVPFLAKNGVRSRHLGRHLTIHPAGKIAALMPYAVNGWSDTPQGYGIYELFDKGIMFEGAFVPPELVGIAIPHVGRHFTSIMEQYQNLAIFGLLVSDGPNGRVRIGVGGRPVITYWMSKPDLERMREGLIMLAKVFFAAGAERVILPIAGKEDQGSLDDALAALSTPLDPWRIELAAFHPLGTARMSTTRKGGVVTPELASWEVPGLYVVDGSIFPTSLGVNPQLTIMAYATQAAERIAAELGC